MKKILGIFGPTACGKSFIAQKLAQTNRFRIINADSRQIYKGLDILAAVDALPEYCLYSILETKINVIDWAKLAIIEVEKAFEEELVPVLIGGTGLYFKCMQSGIANLPKIDQTIIEQLEKYSIEELKNQLPENIANKLHDHRRLARALGIFLQTNKHINYYFEQPTDKLHNYELSIFSLIPDKKVVWENIKKRLDLIFPQVFDEVLKFDKESDVIGLSEIRQFLENNKNLKFQQLMQLDEFLKMKEKIFFQTRQYAKRQKTFANNLIVEKEFDDSEFLLNHILSIKKND